MNRRLLGLLAAITLAVLGTVAIVAYVNSAEDRALEGEQVAEVLVVTDEVPAGTPAEDLGDRVKLVRVTEKVKADGAVTTVTSLEGKVASATLVPGEQLVEQRFVEASAYRASARVAVPPGLLETTIALSPDRAVGGVLTPGATVAASLSFDLEGATGPSKVTHMTLRKALVTNVQTSDSTSTTSNNETDSTAEHADAPKGQLLVTLALDDVSAEQLIFAAEHGSVWLSIEPSDAPVGSTKVVTTDNVYGL